MSIIDAVKFQGLTCLKTDDRPEPGCRSSELKRESHGVSLLLVRFDLGES